MIRLFVFLLCLGLLPLTVKAEEFGLVVFDTGPFACTANSAVQGARWDNPHGSTVRIVRSQIWIGADLGARVDIEGAVQRASDGNLLIDFPWDRYANPSGPHHYTQSNDMLLAPGDGLVLGYICRDYWRNGKHGRVRVNIWLAQ